MSEGSTIISTGSSSSFQHSSELKEKANIAVYSSSDTVATACESSENVSQITLKEECHDFPEGGTRAWLVTLGSFLGLVALSGLVNSLGVFQTYVQTNQFSHLSTSTVAWIFSVNLFVCYFGSIFFGRVFDAYGHFWQCAIGTVLYVGCFIILSFCPNSYGAFIALFGIGVGLGCSMLMTPQITIVGHWFLQRRGEAIGLATAGGSVGGVIFPLMLRSLFEKVGFAWATRIFAFTCLFVLILSLILMKGRFSSKDLTFKSLMQEALDLSALKDRRYTGVVIAVLFCELSLLNFLTYIASYGVSVGMSENSSYLLVTVASATGVVGRWLPGLVADKVGRFNTMIITTIVLCILNFGVWLPFGENHTVLYLLSAFYGFFLNSVLSLTPVCCGQVCRTEDFGKRYGTMYFIQSFGVLIGIPITGCLVKNDNYQELVLFNGVIGLCGLLTWLFARHACVGFRLCKV
jgi:MFS family permease